MKRITAFSLPTILCAALLCTPAITKVTDGTDRLPDQAPPRFCDSSLDPNRMPGMGGLAAHHPEMDEEVREALTTDAPDQPLWQRLAGGAASTLRHPYVRTAGLVAVAALVTYGISNVLPCPLCTAAEPVESVKVEELDDSLPTRIIIDEARHVSAACTEVIEEAKDIACRASRVMIDYLRDGQKPPALPSLYPLDTLRTPARCLEWIYDVGEATERVMSACLHNGRVACQPLMRAFFPSHCRDGIDRGTVAYCLRQRIDTELGI